MDAVVAGGALRFHLAVQKSRLGVIALMMALAGGRARRRPGRLRRSAPPCFGFSLGIASVFVFMALHRAAARRGSHAPLHYGWMALDIALICWSIYIMRDSSPLWLIWFLTTATAAAFVAGRRAAHAVIVGELRSPTSRCWSRWARIQGLDHELAARRRPPRAALRRHLLHGPRHRRPAREAAARSPRWTTRRAPGWTSSRPRPPSSTAAAGSSPRPTARSSRPTAPRASSWPT